MPRARKRNKHPRGRGMWATATCRECGETFRSPPRLHARRPFCASICRDAHEVKRSLHGERSYTNVDLLKKASLSLASLTQGGMLPDAQARRFVRLLIDKP